MSGLAYWVIGDQMMNVMAALPPADGQTATEVGDEDANESICDEIMGNASMPGIVGSEHDLMLLIDQQYFGDTRG